MNDGLQDTRTTCSRERGITKRRLKTGEHYWSVISYIHAEADTADTVERGSVWLSICCGLCMSH